MFFLPGPKQCSGSLRFWYGSRSSDPYLCLTDPDADPAPDPALFASDLQDANKKFFFFHSVFMLILFGSYIYIILHR
jgi:hypothetical protein